MKLRRNLKTDDRASEFAKTLGRGLSSIERLLLDSLDLPKLYQPGVGRPDSCSDENRIDSDFLRELILRYFDANKSSNAGVHITGYWISGELSLNRCIIQGSLTFECCYFELEPQLVYAKFHNTLNFDGSFVPGLKAHGVHVEGGANFRNGFSSGGEIGLLRGVFGGDVNFRGANVSRRKITADGDKTANSDDSICINSAMVRGNVFFDKGFRCVGKIRMTEALVENSVIFENANLDSDGEASVISLSRSRIQGSLFLRKLKIESGSINLNDSEVNRLVDDRSSWAPGLKLANFVYGAIDDSSPLRAEDRLFWLAQQATNTLGYELVSGKCFPRTYSPQPWTQLIKTLRETGAKADAISVAIEKELHERKIGIVGGNHNNSNILIAKSREALHTVFGWVSSFGYRPTRIVGTMCLSWFLCGFIYWYGALQGVFAPSSPLIFDSPNYSTCRPGSETAIQKLNKIDNNWYTCERLAGEYTTFSPLAFSLDVLLPLVDFGQAKDWSVIVATPKSSIQDEIYHFSLGHGLRLLIWIEIAIGWILSLILVASVSGLAQKRELQ